MTYASNQKVINSVGGNVMAYLADKNLREIEALENDTHCKNCGTPEVVHHLPQYSSNLIDGLCPKCRRELYDE